MQGKLNICSRSPISLPTSVGVALNTSITVTDLYAQWENKVNIVSSNYME